MKFFIRTMKTCMICAALAAVLTGVHAAEAQRSRPAFRGVVEGYYGRAWGTEGRLSMLEFMGKAGLNMFVYGPKDDPYHHDKWREMYPQPEIDDFKKLLDASAKQGVTFYWAIHLGGTFACDKAADWEALFRKLALMYEAGFRAFAVFFDDFGSADAEAHAQICNRVVREFLATHEGCAPLVMCPNVYWGFGKPYHKTLGEKLDERVMVMWTGAGICSDIRAEDVRRITEDLKRAPLVWWNWPVNDYCRSALLLGRAYGLETDGVAGIVANPMENCEASKVALYSFAKWCEDPEGFDSGKAWDEAFGALYPDRQIAEAMRVFARHNSDQGPNVHRYRREESVADAPLCKKACAELEKDGRVCGETARELTRLFAEVHHAARVLRTKLPHGRYDLGWEIAGWVEDEECLMAQGMVALSLLEAPSPFAAAPQLAHLRQIRDAAKAAAARHVEKFTAATFAADRRNVKRPVASARELKPLVEKMLDVALKRLYRMCFAREAPAAETVRAFSSVPALAAPVASRDGKYATLARVLEPLEIAPGEAFGLAVPKTWTTEYFHARLGFAEAVEKGSIEVSQDGETWLKLLTFNRGAEMHARILPADGWTWARYRNVSDSPVTVKIELFKFDVAEADDPADAMLKDLLK